MDPLEIKSLLDTEVFEESLKRINKLTPETQPQWGKMSVAQMLAHCTEIQDVCNGKELKNTPFLLKLFKGVIKKMVVNNKPYKHSTPTHPQYKQKEQKNFEEQKSRLINSLETFMALHKAGNNQKHSFFGVMTWEEKGWAMFKHLNHHLGQFGV